MKHIASCSFGKDSLAMLLKILELGLPLDEVVYCDIRFNEKSLSGETPEMAAWIPQAEKILKEKFNIKERGEIKTVRSYDGSQVLFCDGWKNSCGHVDYYCDVRKEAKENGLNTNKIGGEK